MKKNWIEITIIERRRMHEREVDSGRKAPFWVTKIWLSICIIISIR